MSKREILKRDLDSIPDGLLDELVDFVNFLKLKSGANLRHEALLSEAKLAEDWSRPEEDIAWANL